MFRPVRVGVQLPQYDANYDALRSAVLRAEDLGFDAVFNWDHFFGPKDTETKSFEAWTMLGAWAESTSRIQFGPLVSATAYRNPDLIADMARTLDHVSGGRFILGLGAGFKERDYLEYGYDFATPAVRVTRFGDALGRIVARMDRLNPPPTRHIPLLIGGGGEKKTLALVARYADVWHTFADGEAFDRKSRILDHHCAMIGRDPGEIERSVLVAGDPFDLNHGADPIHAKGVSFFITSARSPDFDLDALIPWLRWRDERNG